MPFWHIDISPYITSGYFLKLLILLLLSLNLIAQDEYSFRVAFGKASTKDLGEIIRFDSDIHPDNLSVLALDAGYLLKKEIFELPLDLYIKGGLGYFHEGSTPRSDVYETTIYVKVYYNIDFLENRVRLGLGEGLSYTSDVLWTEEQEAIAESEEYAQFLNYLDLSIDFDLGKLVGYKPLEETYIGWTIKHRSGILGLFNGVDGGSNYNTISIEKNF
jgi:outer membrane protein